MVIQVKTNDNEDYEKDDDTKIAEMLSPLDKMWSSEEDVLENICVWMYHEGTFSTQVMNSINKPCVHENVKYQSHGEGLDEPILDCQVEHLLLDCDDECGVKCSKYKPEE